jgi:hypothetical protein
MVRAHRRSLAPYFVTAFAGYVNLVVAINVSDKFAFNVIH